jgi:hypothetical protein
MRKFVTAVLVFSLAVVGLPVLSFAGAPPAKRQNGTVAGKAKNSNGQNLAQTKVRIRNTSTGTIASELTTDGAGGFTGVVPAGSYVVEIVDGAGNVIGLSPTISVVAGATASITVTASAIGAVAAGTAATGGFSLFGLGTAATIGVLGAAAAGGYFAIKAVTGNASPSGL